MSIAEETRGNRTPARQNQRERAEGSVGGLLTERGATKLRAKDIATAIPSIEHFMYLFGTEGKYFLPPQSIVTWAYVKQILGGEKLLLKFDRVESQLFVPRTKGFKVNEAFREMASDTEFLRFFPDPTPHSTVPRLYFLTVSSPGAEGVAAGALRPDHAFPERGPAHRRQVLRREGDRGHAGVQQAHGPPQRQQLVLPFA